MLWTDDTSKSFREELADCAYIMTHDKRKFYFDHTSKHYAYFKNVLPGKDYLGHASYKLNKHGLCEISLGTLYDYIYSESKIFTIVKK